MMIIPDDKDWTWVLERPCPECGFDPASFEFREVPSLINDNIDQWQVILLADQSALAADGRPARRIETMQIPELVWGETATATLLVDRVLGLLAGNERIMIGLAGAPGAGKSTVATALVSALEMWMPGQVTLVPMDGYHLAQSIIECAGQAEIKGAPETFDGYGYVALLARLRAKPGETIYAPEFRRELDDPVAGAIPVPPRVRIVVTEGNYLLLDEAPWSAARDLLDEIWYIALPDELRIRRLVERHMRFKDPEPEACRRATVSDQRNADLVEANSDGATLIVRYN